MESSQDQLDFEQYNGQRRSLHLNKLCWSAKINKNIYGFTQQCENDTMLHVLRQFNKAKEARFEHSFRFQLKFGNIYFPQIPDMLRDRDVSIQQLRDALKKGYKTISVNLDSDIDHDGRLLIVSDTDDQKEEEEVDKEDTKEASIKEESDEKKVKVKKRKPAQCRATSSFDSNINTDEQHLHSLFISNEFEAKSSQSYIVYLNTGHQKECRIKYAEDLKFFKIESVPLKWMCVDIRNTSKLDGNRDIRFKLISEKSIELVDDNCESEKTVLNEKIRNCVFKISEENLIVKEEFRNKNIFIKHAKSIKYVGSSENWQPIFDLVKAKLPANFPSYLLNKVTVCIAESTEYSQNNPNGYFTVMAKQKEVFVSMKVDVKEMKNSECMDIVTVIWFIAKVFSMILE